MRGGSTSSDPLRPSYVRADAGAVIPADGCPKTGTAAANTNTNAYNFMKIPTYQLFAWWDERCHERWP